VRIRQVKPAFWIDEPLSRLSDGARLFYVGLWMLADDGGWLDWNVPEIGAELYRYKGRRVRERAVERYTEELTRLNGSRLVRHDCGHAHLTHLTEHQRVGGRPVLTVESAHARDCARMIADDRHGRVGEGRVGNGRVGDSSTNDDTLAELQRLVADPSTSPDARRAAQKTLSRMGAAA
jgi:hypothetical protein